MKNGLKERKRNGIAGLVVIDISRQRNSISILRVDHRSAGFAVNEYGGRVSVLGKDGRMKVGLGVVEGQWAYWCLGQR